MSNPTIQNVSVVSRYADIAKSSHCTVDGASIAADGVILRGTILVRASVGAKWHAAVHGVDTLALDQVRILKDDLKVLAGQDAFCAAYVEGWFQLSAIIDANLPGAIVAGDLTLAAGFHLIETDEVRLT